MNRDLWVAILLFISSAISLAVKMVPVSDQALPWLLYVAALIQLALTVFFGYNGVKTLRDNRNGAKSDTNQATPK